MLSFNTPSPASVGGQSAAAAPAPIHTAADMRDEHHIWLVTGPAGCGKSTIAEFLGKAMHMSYIEGDNFHPPSNIEKMSKGIPLTDEDRWDWLTALRDESTRRLTAGTGDVVMTCSALKRKYRDVIRVAGYYDHSLHIHFIYLHAPESVILSRVQARKDHYMGAEMVHSQYSILEPPGPDERDVIRIDVSGCQDEIKKSALARVLAVRTGEESP